MILTDKLYETIDLENTLFVTPKNDAESVEIIKLLESYGANYVITEKAWGCTWNNIERSVKEKICEAYLADKQIIGIELGNSVTFDIDHHAYSIEDRGNKFSSIEQVAALLKVPLTTYQQAIAINDTQHIAGMLKAGFSQDIIDAVREEDRTAQGITAEEMAEGKRAIDNRIIQGALTIVHLKHSKCATVTDPLYGQYDQLLIISEDGEINFYGKGSICLVLRDKYEGFAGGNLPDTGFWCGYAPEEKIINLIKAILD